MLLKNHLKPNYLPDIKWPSLTMQKVTNNWRTRILDSGACHSNIHRSIPHQSYRFQSQVQITLYKVPNLVATASNCFMNWKAPYAIAIAWPVKKKYIYRRQVYKLLPSSLHRSPTYLSVYIPYNNTYAHLYAPTKAKSIQVCLISCSLVTPFYVPNGSRVGQRACMSAVSSWEVRVLDSTPTKSNKHAYLSSGIYPL